jgi:hypothetical protein
VTTQVVLTERARRAVWRWCIVYTALAPREQRDRRRTELAGHLYESQRAGQAGRQVVGAALAGAVDDVSWCVHLGIRRVLRAFGTPVPYLVLAGILPVQGAFYWGAQSGRVAHLGKSVSELAALACLLLAGSVHLLRSRRR